VGVIALPVGGVLIEVGGLSDAFGEVFGEVADVSAGFFGAAEDSLDVHLGPEADNVGGFGQLCAGFLPGWQRYQSVGIGKALARVSHTGSRSPS
jgi:hypothetical protein